jgi:hypothetical protein
MIAYSKGELGAHKRDLWVYDISRSAASRFTFDPADDLNAHSDDVDQSFRSHADQIGAKRRRALLV